MCVLWPWRLQLLQLWSITRDLRDLPIRQHLCDKVEDAWTHLTRDSVSGIGEGGGDKGALPVECCVLGKRGCRNVMHRSHQGHANPGSHCQQQAAEWRLLNLGHWRHLLLSLSPRVAL